ncbi:MAG: ATP-binding protein [Verrucomicrobiia bacterium]
MKYEFTFGLENAAWPALLIDSQGIIKRASASAITIFGKGLESGSVNLSTMWSGENDISFGQFLSQIERALQPTQKMILTVAGGATVPFTAHICSIIKEGLKYYIIQLLSESLEKQKVAEKQDKSANGRSLSETDAIFHKQKLECALQLARTVALDFNNALTSIIAHTSFLLSKIELNHALRRSLLEIEKSAQRAAEIAADLAAFSRQEKDVKNETTGNINEVVRRTVELFKKSGEEYPAWILRLERTIYTVNYDEAKIQQALVKVIENSIQSLSDKGRGTITLITSNIDLTAPRQDRNVKLAPGKYVCIEVRDDGCGISAENINRVFEPFFTTKKGHRGLGLTWVYGIITNHGGNVAISSEQGRGTSVRIYLPAVGGFAKDVSGSIENLYGKGTILMVDDEDLILTMAQTVLPEYGYKLLTANNGKEALEIIKKEKDNLDLIITDLVMPQMSGRELVEQVLKIAPRIKILYTSGFVRPLTKDESNYLQKPFTSQDLLLKVKQILSPEL